MVGRGYFPVPDESPSPLLESHGILLFSRNSAQIHAVRRSCCFSPSLLFGWLIASRYDASRLRGALRKISILGIIIAIAYVIVEWRWAGADVVTAVVLPALAALLATYLLMRKPGVRAFCRALLVSLFMFVVCFLSAGSGIQMRPNRLFNGWRPWSLNSPWSLALAWAIVGIYLAINAAFLQPYRRRRPIFQKLAGECRGAACDQEGGRRYARAASHGLYDRIIIVAHSLGCVVSYDMLRAYSAGCAVSCRPVRSDRSSPISMRPPGSQTSLREDDMRALRVKARQAIASIAAAARLPASERQYKSWLVTDFVTLGNALTHAHYLMCQGKNREDLEGFHTPRRRKGVTDLPAQAAG